MAGMRDPADPAGMLARCRLLRDKTNETSRITSPRTSTGRKRPQPMRAGWVQDITWSGSLRVRQYAFALMHPSTAAAGRDLYISAVGSGASLTGLTFVAIPQGP